MFVITLMTISRLDSVKFIVYFLYLYMQVQVVLADEQLGFSEMALSEVNDSEANFSKATFSKATFSERTFSKINWSVVSKLESTIQNNRPKHKKFDFEHGNLSKFELELQPEASWNYSRNSQLFTRVRVRHGVPDLLEPNNEGNRYLSDASQVYFLSDYSELELRELSWRYESENYYLRLGKQKIVWGKSDSLKVLDVINPQNLREFILDDFENSRIPLWSLLYEKSLSRIDHADLQFIWIPDTSYHVFPDDGLFSLQTYSSKNGENINIRYRVKKPNDFLNDADWGLRLSGFSAGWDWSLNYFYHYDDSPITRIRRVNQTDYSSTIFLIQDYFRTHLLGASFANAFDSVSVMGEYALFVDKHFRLNNDKDNWSRKNQSKLMPGIDWSGAKKTFIRSQIFHFYTHASEKESETQFTLSLGKRFLHDTLNTQIHWISQLNKSDGLWRVKAEYDFSDELMLYLGLDQFYGARKGMWGQFDENDRWIFGVKIAI